MANLSVFRRNSIWNWKRDKQWNTKKMKPKSSLFQDTLLPISVLSLLTTSQQRALAGCHQTSALYKSLTYLFIHSWRLVRSCAMFSSISLYLNTSAQCSDKFAFVSVIFVLNNNNTVGCMYVNKWICSLPINSVHLWSIPTWYIFWISMISGVHRYLIPSH